MKQTVAAYIAKTLEQAGVKRIWGVTGDSLNGLSDSLNRMGTIDWMPTRHEEVAAATMFRCWLSPPIFLPVKSAAAIFRRRTLRSCSANAATTANWSHPRNKFRRCWPSPCAKQ